MVIGNSAAPILITVACNPYCGPCAKAHLQLDELMKNYKDGVKVQIRLLYNAENENDKLSIAVRTILQKALSCQNNKVLEEMLSDWFVWMDLEKWNAKWQVDNNIDVKARLKEHNNWITENKITATPTFFINGKKLPGRYHLKDIEILLPQLLGKLTVTGFK